MIQIFRADFGSQSADSSSDEPPESESDKGWRETERRLTAGQSAIWVNGALAQMRTNMFLCVRVCVCARMCSGMIACLINHVTEFMCACETEFMCVSTVYLCVCVVCWCVQLNWSCFIHPANSITAGWMFGPLTLCSKTRDPFKCCLLTSNLLVVSLSYRLKYKPAGPGRLPFTLHDNTLYCWKQHNAWKDSF